MTKLLRDSQVGNAPAVDYIITTPDQPLTDALITVHGKALCETFHKCESAKARAALFERLIQDVTLQLVDIQDDYWQVTGDNA